MYAFIIICVPLPLMSSKANHGAIHRQIVIYAHDNIRDRQDPDMHAKALEKKKEKTNKPKNI